MITDRRSILAGLVAGVPTAYEGVTHEFFGMGAVVAAADAAEDLAGHDLKEAFAKAGEKKKLQFGVRDVGD